MKYVSAKQFKSQSKYIQETFIKWWEMSVGDIYDYVEEDTHDCVECECIKSKNQLLMLNTVKAKGTIIPLLTEGQLRQFIQDMTGLNIFLEYKGYDKRKHHMIQINFVDIDYINTRRDIEYMNNKKGNAVFIEGEQQRDSIIITSLTGDILTVLWKLAIHLIDETIIKKDNE